MTETPEFSRALAESRDWLDDLTQRLGWQHREWVLPALTASLHALRDLLPPDEAARLGAGLPALMRGFYYEGWHPQSGGPRHDSREAFLARIHEGVGRDPGIDPEFVARTVLALVADRLAGSELEEIKAACPPALHGLWPA